MEGKTGVGALSSDEDFDQLYPLDIRRLSAVHWTPVSVAARAATLLARAGATRILDVGSGVGKFCLVGATVTNARFVGVERRRRLVEIAGWAAARLGVGQVTFVHSNIDRFPFEGFDGIYLYNPFFEQIGRLLPHIDDSVEFSLANYRHLTGLVTDRLSTLATGTAVVSYHGFGGLMPRSYRYEGDEVAGDDRLELWIKE
jgi:SAM-dependent methyltransferase